MIVDTWMRRMGIVVLIGGMCIGDYCLGVTQAIAARPADTVTNIRVVDSSPTPVTVGEVVGASVEPFVGSAFILLLLNPALTDQKISPLVQANGQGIFGTLGQLSFTEAACSGTAIFQWTDANGELFLGKHITAPTFIVPLTSSSFKLYIADMGATPTVFPVMSYMNSVLFGPPGCHENVGFSAGIPAGSTFTLDLTPPFKLVNP